MLISCLAAGTTYEVGSTKQYVSPNALYQANVLEAGDTILIDGETYAGTACLARWGADNLYIKGVNGRPHLVADGAYILGKGIWVLAGNDITVENIEFSGAAVPDHNGAGIRLDGTGLTVRYCDFHDNETGILTSNQGVGDILVEYTEFAHNSYGDGFSHNIYVGRVNSLTFRFNYSHHAVEGHNLKSRANENYIYYNRIMDETDGASSRLIDLPNGGFCIVMGNLLMQGNNAPNSNMVGYGQEGFVNSPNQLFFINNTLVNRRIASCRFVDIAGQPDEIHLANNIFAGTGTLTVGVVTTFENNLVETDITQVRFVDEGNYDYNLLADSPAQDYGVSLDPVDGHSLTPAFVYVHPTDGMPRAISNVIDAGAYEYEASLSVDEPVSLSAVVFPNPTPGVLKIDPRLGTPDQIQVFTASGTLVIRWGGLPEADLSVLPDGAYVIFLTWADGTSAVELVCVKK